MDPDLRNDCEAFTKIKKKKKDKIVNCEDLRRFSVGITN